MPKHLGAWALLLVVSCAPPLAQGVWGHVRIGDQPGAVPGVVICAAGSGTPELIESWAPSGSVACARSDQAGRFLLPLDAGTYRLCQVLDADDAHRLPCDCELVEVRSQSAVERDRSLHPSGGGWSGAGVPGCVGRDRETFWQFDPVRYRNGRDAGQ